MHRIVVEALLAGALALASLGLGTGSTQADPATHICNRLAMCSRVWCPGSPLPQPDVVWDMNMCHHYYRGSLGQPGTDGGIPVGAHILEGDPARVNTCSGALIRLWNGKVGCRK
ncbi:hypothetical protein BN973_03896 [Mycobacterium triplex]|uniref:Secreted protein n=1 Tax=Mycobacterium triplex TaxID=47839 RepID=A0A024K108_9MYCO|nr:hypothetical protein BN973_03896 [Mycobacterium triplex]